MYRNRCIKYNRMYEREINHQSITSNIHTGLVESLAIAMHTGKWQIFTKGFAKEWVEYPFALVRIAITKDLIFCIAIAKLSVNGT